MPRNPVLQPAGIRTALTYAAIFCALGAHLPFWPLWLSDWGLSEAEIGSFTAAGMVIRVIAGLAVPALADRIDNRRLVLAGVAGFGAIAFAVHGLLDDRTLLMLATLSTGVVFAGMIPIADALGGAAARTAGFSYAPARSMGSLAFLLASLGVGWLIGKYGIVVAQWWIVVSLALTIWFGATHPGGGKVRQSVPPRFADLMQLLSEKRFLVFIGAIGFAQSSHAVLYAYGSLHWRALGVDEGVIGQLWAFAVGVETLLMLLFGTWLIRRFGAVGAITVSAAAGIVRWAIMMTDPSGAMLWVLQGFHSLTFAAGHLGGIAFIAAAVPERLAASAQGMFSSAIGGILVALAMAGAAVIYPMAGGLTYGVSAVMSAIGLIFAIWLGRIWNGGQTVR
ncbi:MFS transporter, PPP family, 3-phenylpropionic acid transporter [Monaibacterium marinum]|uniref:MFS transporter, PPP family, 3-phenylpropionic acid transporter n=1 Tax=Pontivivens marinum TaxID=1690039 RepID=A0A2C9CRU8_9RHOB|nr:MFS transporter [Monaibacterium marinum]SOH94076.1 MFS transporter, PPP family, 3-phenylpropionic acid transporter [Monaibacterium marinum]